MSGKMLLDVYRKDSLDIYDGWSKNPSRDYFGNVKLAKIAFLIPWNSKNWSSIVQIFVLLVPMGRIYQEIAKNLCCLFSFSFY
jgi:hypothetical protein